MKHIAVLPLTVAGGLIIAGIVGGAQAQVPVIDSTTRSISVRGEGYGGKVKAKSTVAARKAPYRAALDAAMDDAREKAEAIAAKSGGSLGEVQEVVEETSAAQCGSPRTKTTCSMRATVNVTYVMS